jgi:glucose/arabinose dehydrogenase
VTSTWLGLAAPRRGVARLGSVALVVVLAAVVAAGCSAAPASPSPRGSTAAGGPSGGPGPSRKPNPPAPTPAAAEIALEVVADRLGTPVGLVAYPGRPDVEVVWEQTGKVHVLRDGALLDRPFLDLTRRLVDLLPDYDERGLLGLAFHPRFAENGRVFVYYGAPTRDGATGDHTNRLSEFRLDPTDPWRVDPASERVLLELEQPQFNHSGGGLGFGPDGRLYLGTGDGGGEGDASPGHSSQGNAQDPMRLNGKVLRIDVDHPSGGRAYGIPSDNPFASDPSRGRPEIYALGFRNPWRLAWEPGGERRLLVSDVGFGRYEEVDAVVRGGNYGWRIREGAHCLDLAAPLSELAICAANGGDGGRLIDPVVEYRHADIGIAVVGGYVYRGAALPSLAGQYVFADLTRDWHGSVPTPRGTIMAATPSDSGTWAWRQLRLEGGLLPAFITGMGEGADGELYVLARQELGPTGETGRILRLVPPTP